jgi:hypothetical protein
MFDVVEQGVFQAQFPDRAFGANALGDLYADPITGKEGLGRQFPALALRHPVGVQHIGSFLGSALRRGSTSEKKGTGRTTIRCLLAPRAIPDGFSYEAASPLCESIPLPIST